MALLQEHKFTVLTPYFNVMWVRWIFMSNRRDLNLTVHGAVEGAALGEDGVLVTSTLSEVHSHSLKVVKNICKYKVKR